MAEKIVKDSHGLVKDLANDSISRKAAIDAIKKCRNESDMPDMWNDGMSCALRCIYQLSSAQPETHDKRTETHARDLISRQALCEYALNQKDKSITANDIMRVPPVQPSSSCSHENEEYEWCHDCKEYDQDAHCCHRWTKAIRKTVEELEETWPKQPWIPVTARLPKDYEDVLVWYEYFKYGEYNRMVHTCDVGYYISEFNRWGGGVTGQKVRAIAWMPLPEPPKEDDYDHT